MPITPLKCTLEDVLEEVKALRAEMAQLRQDLSLPRSRVGNVPAISQTDEPILMSQIQAARYMGISRWTLGRLIKSGEIETVRIGPAQRLKKENIDSYLAGGTYDAVKRANEILHATAPSLRNNHKRSDRDSK